MQEHTQKFIWEALAQTGLIARDQTQYTLLLLLQNAKFVANMGGGTTEITH